jgi:hypothetical protein
MKPEEILILHEVNDLFANNRIEYSTRTYTCPNYISFDVKDCDGKCDMYEYLSLFIN